jgi:peroxiredoxin
MRRRILVLPVAAVLIALLCVHKLSRSYPRQDESLLLPVVEKQAPAFELLDQNKPSELVRLRRYLDHAEIVVVFFDGEHGADHSGVLQHLRGKFAKLQKSGIAVLAVSTALPQQNRKIIENSGAFPFPLLSDPDLSVHQAWGRIDAATGRPLTGVFLVDRAGRVSWSPTLDIPAPLAGAEDHIAEAVQGLLNEHESR